MSTTAVHPLIALSAEHHRRRVRPLSVAEVAGQLVKVYALEAPDRHVDQARIDATWPLVEQELRRQAAGPSAGIGFVVLHLGIDGYYLIVQTWTDGLIAQTGIFATAATAPPDSLRRVGPGVGPCVWEAAIVAHERDALVRQVLEGSGDGEQRRDRWCADVLAGEVS